jgi:hypothetical protein
MHTRLPRRSATEDDDGDRQGKATPGRSMSAFTITSQSSMVCEVYGTGRGLWTAGKIVP